MASRGVAFFDRDGTLNRDKGYVWRPADVEWIAGAAEAVRLANRAGLAVVVATNQSGVARGLYAEADVERLHAWMAETLAGRGARIDRFYFCPYHAEAAVDAYRVARHPDRKPNPGMLRRAIAELSLDPARSFMIGDRPTDVAAGARAGMASYLFTGGDLSVLTAQAIAELGAPE